MSGAGRHLLNLLSVALAACSSAAQYAPGPDASLREEASVTDGEAGAIDARDTDAAEASPDPSCPILEMPGNAPPNPCTACASARCCPVVTACFSGGVDAGSYLTTDGGYSDCYALFLCNNACIGIPNNGWSTCIHACEEQYPDALVRFTKVVACFNNPALCGADADICQIPNPDGGTGGWPYPP